MTNLLHELVLRSAGRTPDAHAVVLKGQHRTYAGLAQDLRKVAEGLLELHVRRLERVAVYLPKTFETVAATFGISQAGAVFVPVNPILKREQVVHILRDCNVRVLITSAARFRDLAAALADCPDLHTIVVTDADASAAGKPGRLQVVSWNELGAGGNRPCHRNVDADIAAILYTSGSTGKPKGVVLSHRNMVTGAESVAQYLGNTPEDRLLAVLPFSFDYGFSQLSTAFHVGACVVLLDYLLPRDVIAAAAEDRITGLAGVPPLWVQLADLTWPETITDAPALHRRTPAARCRLLRWQNCDARCLGPGRFSCTDSQKRSARLTCRRSRWTAARFDRQSHTERRDPRRASGRCAMRCRTSLASSCTAARSSHSATGTISRRPAERFKPVPEPGSGARTQRDGSVVGRHRAHGRGRLSVLHRSRATR